MPGEQLVCVWQAAKVLDSNQASGNGAPTIAVRKVTSLFRHLQCVNFSEVIFDKTFTEETIPFEKYKHYVKSSLREKGVSFGIVQDTLEGICWDVAKGSLTSSISDATLKQLWEICNRLIVEDHYPPRLDKQEACWLMEKILAHLDKNMITTEEILKANTFSCTEFVQILDEVIYKQSSKEKVKSCIEDLHVWLVAEILKKEKAYIRCKKQSNWTTWGKRCCILTPRSISVYNESLDRVSTSSKKKIELVFTKNTKVESLPMYNGIIHRLQGRFWVANEPFMELEIAVDDDNQKRSWLTEIEDIITCIKDNTTPVQKLLHDRYEKRINNASAVVKTNSLERLENALEDNLKRVSRAVLNKPEVKVIPPKKDSVIDVTDKEISTPYVKSPEIQINNNRELNETIKLNRDKLKAIFVKIDTNGNGLLDKNEFAKFIQEMGLKKMSDKETNLVFRTIDRDNKGQITFDQFEGYFLKYVMDETVGAECVNAMRKAFLEADRDGSGTLNFREFTEYISEKKRSVRMSKVLNAFTRQSRDEITFSDFQDMVKIGNSDLLTTIVEDEFEEMKLDDSNVGQLRDQLKQAYSESDSEQLATYIRDRWKKFATFRRQGKSGTVVMKGGHGMVADFVPGEYSLIDLTCFSDLPPLVPKYTAVKGVTWESSSISGKSGKILFPSDFDGKVVTDVATSELVRYYGCSFADANQEKVSLLFRHGIQDFTYENGYLEKYVTATNGGAGIERHQFSHLDCPLTSDSGIFILAKFTEDGEFHVTGFKIPIRHTLYIPGGCIHCNDYLRGTWRTMLSDETDIDHVHLTKRNDVYGDEIYDNNETKFQFKFV